MEKYNDYIPAAEGVLRSFIITVLMLLIFAVIMTFVEVDEYMSSIFYIVTTILSIMYGAIYASQKIRKKGWFIGIVVALLYVLILYVVSVISGNSAVIGYDGIKRFVLALLVGSISGMIGVNM
ncbi:MAG: TIGR04086 family membrane protein [Clostridium sp.]|uniref:TIGR04086 family membrane protein n=1 Tax=Clostridium sp. TaxID=1506 RepID=UPI0025C2E8E8|nr:TIGR04086 family membrane protein [Clostridium sp.]MCH3962886.1 TIGR04086 family membrane protein [Clostridium sp.]MCI1715699.1 TIGR04086 family membrane protein [Clostridium sp.]MCI1800096.1 TIGR04086 family membrane protein [Clostridium sp.]MCI1814010.1 TIGR04086 family membrane protein [Clostridium sp.]MCI1870908.1 TIGR04086 family membrane protein [Clostridium sp.]